MALSVGQLVVQLFGQLLLDDGLGGRLLEEVGHLALGQPADLQQCVNFLAVLELANLEPVVLRVQAQHVFALLEEEDLHVAECFLQLANLGLALPQLPLDLVLLLVRALILLHAFHKVLMLRVVLGDLLAVILQQLA